MSVIQAGLMMNRSTVQSLHLDFSSCTGKGSGCIISGLEHPGPAEEEAERIPGSLAEGGDEDLDVEGEAAAINFKVSGN